MRGVGRRGQGPRSPEPLSRPCRPSSPSTPHCRVPALPGVPPLGVPAAVPGALLSLGSCPGKPRLSRGSPKPVSPRRGSAATTALRDPPKTPPGAPPMSPRGPAAARLWSPASSKHPPKKPQTQGAPGYLGRAPPPRAPAGWGRCSRGAASSGSAGAPRFPVLSSCCFRLPLRLFLPLSSSFPAPEAAQPREGREWSRDRSERREGYGGMPGVAVTGLYWDHTGSSSWVTEFYWDHTGSEEEQCHGSSAGAGGWDRRHRDPEPPLPAPGPPWIPHFRTSGPPAPLFTLPASRLPVCLILGRLGPPLLPFPAPSPLFVQTRDPLNSPFPNIPGVPFLIPPFWENLDFPFLGSRTPGTPFYLSTSLPPHFRDPSCTPIPENQDPLIQHQHNLFPAPLLSQPAAPPFSLTWDLWAPIPDFPSPQPLLSSHSGALAPPFLGTRFPGHPIPALPLCQLFMSPLSLVCGPPWIPKLSLLASSVPPDLHVPPVLHSLQFLEVVVSEPSPGVPHAVAASGAGWSHRQQGWGRELSWDIGIARAGILGQPELEHWDSQSWDIGIPELGYWDSQSRDIGIARARILGQLELGYWDSQSRDIGIARARILGQLELGYWDSQTLLKDRNRPVANNDLETGLVQRAGLGSVGWRTLRGWDGISGDGGDLDSSSKGLPGAGTQLHGSVLSSFPGLHTVQGISSCDLLSNRAPMDPMDFISFQLGSGSFVVSDGAAWIIQRCWESKGNMVEEMKHYLGHSCVEGPPKYIRYGREALEHKGGCKRGRVIPVGMGDSGMGDLGMQGFPWNFHDQISHSSQWISPLTHCHGNSIDPNPLPRLALLCLWQHQGTQHKPFLGCSMLCPGQEGTARVALVAPGTWPGCSRCRDSWGMFQSRAESKQQFLEGILPLGNSLKCWGSVSLGQAMFPGCALSLGCPLSLSPVPWLCGARVLGENNPEPQLGQFPHMGPVAPSHPQYGVPIHPRHSQYGSCPSQYDPSMNPVTLIAVPFSLLVNAAWGPRGPSDPRAAAAVGARIVLHCQAQPLPATGNSASNSGVISALHTGIERERRLYVVPQRCPLLPAPLKGCSDSSSAELGGNGSLYRNWSPVGDHLMDALLDSRFEDVGPLVMLWKRLDALWQGSEIGSSRASLGDLSVSYVDIEDTQCLWGGPDFPCPRGSELEDGYSSGVARAPSPLALSVRSVDEAPRISGGLGEPVWPPCPTPRCRRSGLGGKALSLCAFPALEGKQGPVVQPPSLIASDSVMVHCPNCGVTFPLETTQAGSPGSVSGLPYKDDLTDPRACAVLGAAIGGALVAVSPGPTPAGGQPIPSCLMGVVPAGRLCIMAATLLGVCRTPLCHPATSPSGVGVPRWGSPAVVPSADTADGTTRALTGSAPPSPTAVGAGVVARQGAGVFNFSATADAASERPVTPHGSGSSPLTLWTFPTCQVTMRPKDHGRFWQEVLDKAEEMCDSAHLRSLPDPREGSSGSADAAGGVVSSDVARPRSPGAATVRKVDAWATAVQPVWAALQGWQQPPGHPADVCKATVHVSGQALPGLGNGKRSMKQGGARTQVPLQTPEPMEVCSASLSLAPMDAVYPVHPWCDAIGDPPASLTCCLAFGLAPGSSRDVCCGPGGNSAMLCEPAACAGCKPRGTDDLD
ncbi:hypothetical protein DV515_00016421 [Chloebia gouldiae]|uniref:MHC class I-like antigen recognition-like domain-containing protein n=1 Tax=Chloebia gouldiae TaxID=44316 RepID=A0A3L8RSP1_CHLGU|nr:hypothetical protein DV515_00016421 [Chloebia gouldiae]